MGADSGGPGQHRSALLGRLLDEPICWPAAQLPECRAGRLIAQGEVILTQRLAPVTSHDEFGRLAAA